MASMTTEVETTEVKPPADGIGSQASNLRFLHWLVAQGDSGMIARGCSLCRVIGHPFTEHCRL